MERERLIDAIKVGLRWFKGPPMRQAPLRQEEEEEDVSPTPEDMAFLYFCGGWLVCCCFP